MNETLGFPSGLANGLRNRGLWSRLLQMGGGLFWNRSIDESLNADQPSVIQTPDGIRVQELARRGLSIA